MQLLGTAGLFFESVAITRTHHFTIIYCQVIQLNWLPIQEFYQTVFLFHRRIFFMPPKLYRSNYALSMIRHISPGMVYRGRLGEPYISCISCQMPFSLRLLQELCVDNFSSSRIDKVRTLFHSEQQSRLNIPSVSGVKGVLMVIISDFSINSSKGIYRIPRTNSSTGLS